MGLRFFFLTVLFLFAFLFVFMFFVAFILHKANYLVFFILEFMERINLEAWHFPQSL